MEDGGEVTRLLGEMGKGQKDAINQLLPLVYDELHRLARGYFRRERGEHTLQPTALASCSITRASTAQRDAAARASRSCSKTPWRSASNIRWT